MSKGKEFMTCPYCGGRMVWSTPDMAYELCDEYDEEDTAVVDYYVCQECGRDFEIYEPNEEARKTTYKQYWNNIK